MSTMVRSRWDDALDAVAPEVVGTVRGVVGLSVEVAGTGAAVGELVRLGGDDDADGVLAEVVATSGSTVRCMPLGATRGMRAGMPVRPLGTSLRVPVGP